MITENIPSYDVLLSENKTNLMRLAYSLTRDLTHAEDLFQDTMLLALRFKNSYQNGTNIKAWLSRIMRNRHISILRRIRLEEHVLEHESTFSLKQWSIGEMGRNTMKKDGNVYPDESFSDTVQSAISLLKPEYKKVLMLCDVNELSYAEAAKVLNCPVGTVMSRLHRGRKTLRKKLGSRNRLELAA